VQDLVRAHLEVHMSRFVLLAAGALILGTAARGSAQQAPPIPGVTGTLALEGTVDKTYAGASALLVKASDGIHHLFHVTRKTAVHGTEAAFDDLAPGSRVVIHYTIEKSEKTAVEVDRIADDGVREMAGTVTRVDRGAKQLSIQLADGSRETLQLSERAAKHVGGDIDHAAGSAKVVVYYTEEDGGKVAHYFKRIREE
jgi:hypothetical protein